MISGVGLASAMISGFSAIFARSSGFSTPAAESPRKTSAPIDRLGQHTLVALLRVDGLPFVHQLDAALIDHALDVANPDVLALGAEDRPTG